MIDWQDFSRILGQEDHSAGVEEIKARIQEPAIVEASPLGDRRYYSFRQHGVLLLFEQNVLDTVSFYAAPQEDFSRYEAKLPCGVTQALSEADVLRLLGPPSAHGGGREDKLLGYLPRWMKYGTDDAVVHIEFSRQGQVRVVSLMKR